MKQLSLLLISSCALLVFFFPQKSYSQCSVLPNAVAAGITLPSASGGTGNRSGVAYNPIDGLYYSINAGSSSYPIETFDANGTLLSSPAAGFSYRGCWWNPLTNQLEANGFSTAGILNINLDPVTKYALNGGGNLFGANQPNTQSVGDLDVSRYLIVYYDNGQIFRYSRTNNAPVDTLTVTGLPAGTANANTIMATGCAGLDYALYDISNKAVWFLDSLGAYISSSQLPASAPTVGASFQVSMANNLLWLYDAINSEWEAYDVLSPQISAASCAVLPNAVGTSLILPSSAGGTLNRTSVAYNPVQSLYYSIKAGSVGFPIETYDINGTLLSSPSAGFDYRGGWWNPYVNQLEGNGGSNTGIWSQSLDPVTKYALNGGTSIFATNQPGLQSIGDLDVSRYLIVYYNNGQIFRYSRTNNAPVDTIDVTGLPAGTVNYNTIMSTGCAGLDYVLYDIANKVAWFVDSTGAYVSSSQLPASAPTHNGTSGGQQVSMANNLLWLYDDIDDQWEAYEVFQLCTPKATALTDTICQGDSYVLGTQTLTTAGMYAETFVAADGCDSIVSLSLLVNTSYNDTLQASVCPGDSYTFPDGSTLTDIQAATVYTSSFMTATGCDSLIITDLQVNPTYAFSFSDSICEGDSYVFPDGRLLEVATVSLVDTSFFQSVQSCDSLIIIDLAVNSVDATISSSDSLLTALATNVSYQWLRCDNGSTPIAGATDQTFSPSASGSYAVLITDLTTGCVDTSACVDFWLTGIFQTNTLPLRLYPNPTTSTIMIDWGQTYSQTEIALFDATGKLMENHQVSHTSSLRIDLSAYPAGIYAVQIRANDKMASRTLIRK